MPGPEAFQQPKIETKKVDAEYAGLVLRFFKKAIEYSGGDEDFEEYLRELERPLQKLSMLKLEEMREKDVAMSLAYLLSVMSNYDPNIDANHGNDPAQIKINEKNYLEPKNLFTKSCEKLFPSKKVNISSDLSINFKKLDDGALKNITLEEEKLSSHEINTILKENPEKLKKIIVRALYKVGTMLGQNSWTAFENYKNGNNPLAKELEEKIAVCLEPTYKLFLMRDEIDKRIKSRDIK